MREPTIIWVQDNSPHKGYRPTQMIDPCEVQPLVNQLSEIAATIGTPACPWEPRLIPRHTYTYPLQVEVCHESPPASTGLAARVDELPLILILRSNGPKEPPSVIALRPGKVHQFNQALEQAHSDFVAWQLVPLYNQGTLPLQRGQYEEAIPILRKVLLVDHLPQT
jgi:hypothetical protein